MSRWIERFNTHPFQKVWSNLKEELNAQHVDDKTILTSVTELARLKKVIAFLDNALGALDPEFVPSTTWDSFRAQASACRDNINAYKSNRNIGHIQTANEHADNLLSYIRPYYIAPKQTGKVLQASVLAYADTITEFADSFPKKASLLLAKIEENSGKSAAIYQKLERIQENIVRFNSELFEDDESIKEKINDFLDISERNSESIKEFYDDIFSDTRNSLSLKTEIEKAKESVLTDQKSISTLLAETNTHTQKFSEFFYKVFGKTNESGEQIGGIEKDITDRQKMLDEFKEKQEIKYIALNEQIESLLPGATSAGLASAYNEMKLSFEEPIKSSTNLFYLAIAILLLGSLILSIEDIGRWHITFSKYTEWDTVLKSFAYKIPFYAPILWLAFYASKRRSEYQRLQQEYAHKEALAKSYNHYKKQIDELDDEDVQMQKIFINRTIDAIAFNASATLDGKHGDKMPSQDILEKFLGKLDVGQLKDFFKK